MADDQNAPDDSVGKGLRYARRQYGASERRSYDDGGPAEPALPQTAEQQVRDLERIIERVREVVGTDQAVTPAEERVAALEGTLREVLSQFVHKTHPGEPCLQTGHVAVKTVERWRAVLQGGAA